DGSDQVSPAPEDFYFQASGRSVALPAAGYDYNSGLNSFCWRDSHPLEWQLASLHQTLLAQRHARHFLPQGRSISSAIRPAQIEASFAPAPVASASMRLAPAEPRDRSGWAVARR